MTVVKISDKIQLANAEGQTSSCNPLFKPDTITDNYDGNVIPFTNAVKLQRQLITYKLNDEKFNYPMLECS
jgi:hypothetical protein